MAFDIKHLNEQFQDLDWKDLGRWPAAPKWALLVLAFIAVGVAAWFLLIEGKLTELEQEQKQEEKLRKEYTDKLKKAVNLPALKEQKEKVTRYVADLERQLPNKAEMDNLLSDVNYAGISKGLQFELFKPGTVKIENYYAELPIALKLSGNYHKLAGFSADLAALSRIVTLNNISVTALANSPNNMLTLDATAKTFRYLDADEAAKVKKLKDASTGVKK
jgi:type IV pilus assembly protein PilO